MSQFDALTWFALGALCYAAIDFVMGMISARTQRQVLERMRGEILDRQAECLNMKRMPGETDQQLYVRMVEYMRGRGAP